ncbi:MAG TPA: Rieske 2Fe-2S domain-containing protein [Thermoanaerobaculia bacterium]|nr:Rieske 2Fe-2S domain-containing protein [Thermoanaerobaculia bacterium]
MELILPTDEQNASSDWVDAGRAAELLEGSIRRVVLDGRRIALYCTVSGVFASDDSCPHRGGPLSEGVLIGNEVVCPWHLWSFDLRTGLTETVPDLSMQLHEVKIQDDTLLVRLARISHRPLS